MLIDPASMEMETLRRIKWMMYNSTDIDGGYFRRVTAELGHRERVMDRVMQMVPLIPLGSIVAHHPGDKDRTVLKELERLAFLGDKRLPLAWTLVPSSSVMPGHLEIIQSLRAETKTICFGDLY